MNILRYLNFFALVITGFSLLCSVDTTTGTAGSETVNTFALVVCDESANPVSGASVRIVAAETWLRKMVSETNPLLSQATSGNDGMVRLPSDSIYETTINLCADIGSIAVFLESFPVNNLADSIPDTIIIKPATELSGVITSNAILPERIVLQGTDYSARVDQATGNYRFSAVPAGDYHIVAIDADNRLTGVGTIDLHGESERTDSFEADFSGIRVDDFDGAPNLMSYFGIGDWYIAKDGDVTVAFPSEYNSSDSTHIPYENALVTTGAFNGNSLHVSYEAVADSYYYLIVGAKVSSSEAGFTYVDTITFQAKGSGRLAVRLHGEENSDKPQAYAYVDLENTWKRFTITSDMYEVSDPGNTSATWSDVADRMQWLSFLPGADGTDFWLDDVRLEGITMRELLLQ